MKISLRQQGIGFAPFPVSPFRGQAGGTAASAALRLGHSAGPKQNANQRSGPARKLVIHFASSAGRITL